MSEKPDKTTHLGYKTVNTEEKAEKVAEVFHSVASSYDLMNDLMSGGMHHAGMMRSTQEASPDLHQHHQVNASATQAALSAEVGLMDGCQCGCNCESIGCVIGGLGIARAISNHCYVPAAEPFSRKAPKLDQRAAHNLELIRPPSKS